MSVPISRTRWLVEAAKLALQNPAEGLDRASVRLHLDRQLWAHELPPDPDWNEHLHAALGARWPCAASNPFDELWETIQSELRATGLRTGRGVFGGWDDADVGLGRAVSCLATHLRPEAVVETGVARGLTSRIVLESLHAAGRGHLWSIDLLPIDESLHAETGAAVPQTLRTRWTYIEGASRRRLRPVLVEHGPIDLFIHDSLHTARNLHFELEHAWSALRPGAAVVADDIHRNDAFGDFASATRDAAALVVSHSDGLGCFGIMLRKPR